MAADVAEETVVVFEVFVGVVAVVADEAEETVVVF